MQRLLEMNRPTSEERVIDGHKELAFQRQLGAKPHTKAGHVYTLKYSLLTSSSTSSAQFALSPLEKVHQTVEYALSEHTCQAQTTLVYINVHEYQFAT